MKRGNEQLYRDPGEGHSRERDNKCKVPAEWQRGHVAGVGEQAGREGKDLRSERSRRVRQGRMLWAFVGTILLLSGKGNHWGAGSEL